MTVQASETGPCDLYRDCAPEGHSRLYAAAVPGAGRCLCGVLLDRGMPPADRSHASCVVPTCTGHDIWSSDNGGSPVN